MSAFGSRPDVRDRIEVTRSTYSRPVGSAARRRPEGLPLIAAPQPLAELLGAVASQRQLNEEAHGWRTRSPQFLANVSQITLDTSLQE
jgi:hypothetical protein